MAEETVTAVRDPEEVKKDFRKTAFKVGLFFVISFVLRYIAKYTGAAINDALTDSLGYTERYIIRLSISGTFLQILPAVIGAFMFGWVGKNGTGIKPHYRIPKSNTRALGNFPAIYGAGASLNLQTIIITYILTKGADLTNRVNVVTPALTGGMGCALALCFVAVCIAPVFEEFVYRGVLLSALKPYGNGLAIFTTGIMFGLAHANFEQMFYAAAIGICLGYIADVTDSVFPTTILHLMVNSVAAIQILFLTSDPVQNFIFSGMRGDIPDSDMFCLAVFGIFMISLFILIIAGIVSFAAKMKQIKKYKVPKVCTEIRNSRKVLILMTTLTVILSLLMVADTVLGISAGIIGVDV